MRSKERKLAYYQALTNAEEMIRTHGEEGGIEQKDYIVDVNVYIEEKNKVADLIGKIANKYKQKHDL